MSEPSPPPPAPPAPPPAKAKASGDPNVAALLTWFLPGAGHFYLGRARFGVIAFVVVQGLYLCGLLLTKGMTFEFLEPELRSAFAPALSPEAANLGAFLWQLNHYGFGEGHPRPWPDGIVLGSMLCATSGLLNVLVMIHAHWDARGGAGARPLAALRTPAIATGLAWFVPGLGHLVQGRRLRGLIVFALLVGLFLTGTWLAEASNLSRERHFYYWSGQFVLGAPALLAEFALGAKRVTGPITHMDAGLVYGCVAGLLNVLAMIDVYAWSEAEALDLPKKSAARAHAKAAGEGA